MSINAKLLLYVHVTVTSLDIIRRFLIYLKIQSFEDWILSKSSGGT
jgi:hypothetical protein